MITSVSTLSPYLNTHPFAFISSLPYLSESPDQLFLCHSLRDFFIKRPLVRRSFRLLHLLLQHAGLARYTSLDLHRPIRPTKLRFVVETHLSCAARIPIYPPRHGPQVGVLTTAPASNEDFEQVLPRLPEDRLPVLPELRCSEGLSLPFCPLKSLLLHADLRYVHLYRNRLQPDQLRCRLPHR